MTCEWCAPIPKRKRKREMSWGFPLKNWSTNTHEGVKQRYRVALASNTVVSVVCIKCGKSEKLAKESPHSQTSATSHHWYIYYMAPYTGPPHRIKLGSYFKSLSLLFSTPKTVMCHSHYYYSQGTHVHRYIQIFCNFLYFICICIFNK